MLQSIRSFSAVVNKTFVLWCALKCIKVIYASDELHDTHSWKEKWIRWTVYRMTIFVTMVIPVFIYIINWGFLKLDAIDPFPVLIFFWCIIFNFSIFSFDTN